MSIQTPGFSERVFEFAFNAEYANRNRAVLVGAPHIPTQNAEKALGYDVEFTLQSRGGPSHAIALQHKVSRFVDKRGPTKEGKRYWNSVGQPYFAFRLDTYQYNVIFGYAAKKVSGFECYYCAPLFADRKSMDGNYLAKHVERRSLWIDVSSAGPLVNDTKHTIVYASDGSCAFLFSEEPKPLVVLNSDVRRKKWEHRKSADFQSAAALYDATLDIVDRQWQSRSRVRRTEVDSAFKIPRRRPTREEPTLANAGKLMAQYVGLSLLVEVKT